MTKEEIARNYADHKMSYCIYHDRAWQRFYEAKLKELENE